MRKYYYDTLYNELYDEATAAEICLAYNPDNQTVEELIQENLDSGDWELVLR